MSRFFLVLLLWLSFDAVGQIDLTLSTGYSCGDRVPITGGTARLYPGGLYRLGVNYHLDADYSVEASYSFQYLDARAQSNFLQLNVDEKVAFNYFLIGGLRHFELSEKSSVYGGLKLGALTIASLEGDFRSLTRFAAGFGAGFRYLLTERLGLNTGVQLLFPITNVGASFWWSPGQGTSVGVTSSTPFVQFGASAGLFLRLPN
jgi:hypothetical protein